MAVRVTTRHASGGSICTFELSSIMMLPTVLDYGVGGSMGFQPFLRLPACILVWTHPMVRLVVST